MSDIFASLAAGTARPAGSQGGTGGEAPVRIVDPSPDLARLAIGDSLRGTVVGRDEHGHLQVRTHLGVLTLAVPRPLPVGTEVVLQVRSVGPQVLLNLLPLQIAAGSAAVQPGQAAPPPAGAGTTTPLPASPPTNPPANPNDLVQRGQLLRAVLHAAPPLPSLAGLPTAQPGSDLTVRILSIGVQSPGLAGIAAPPVAHLGGTVTPALAPVGVPAPAGLVTSPAAVPGPAAPPPGGPAAPPAATPQQPFAGDAAPGLRLAPQTPVAASGHSLAAALQAASSDVAAKAAGGAAAALPGPAVDAAGAVATPATVALRLTGLVTATTSSGQPILHTPLGTLTLDTRAALPQGTSLALEIVLPAAVREAAMAMLPPAWPNLESLEEALFQGLPAAQAAAVARALPQVGPRLASGILFFLAALNQGNVGGWLAQAVAGARDELPGSLVERLGREVAGLARSIDTPAGEWRFVNLPLWSDAGLRELRCFFRHQEGGGQRGGDKATRFVLELELQRHGELQLDGLVRGRLFDLVLRSRRPLPAPVRGDLLALFEDTNAIAGYGGRLSFQASQDWLQLLASRADANQREGFRV
jgi:hypothetical protein